MVIHQHKVKRRSVRGPRRAQWRRPGARRHRGEGAGKGKGEAQRVPDLSRYEELGLTDGDVALGEVPDI